MESKEAMFESTQITGFRKGASRYPRYDAAALGFEGFWYPVMFARDLHANRSR